VAGRSGVAITPPAPDFVAHAAPPALLESFAPVPVIMFCAERGGLGIVGMLRHHVVGEPLDVPPRDEARADHPLPDRPT